MSLKEQVEAEIKDRRFHADLNYFLLQLTFIIFCWLFFCLL